MDYPDFVAFVRRAAEEVGQNGLLKVPELRRWDGSPPREVFDRHLVSLRDDGYVHLLTHVQTEAIPEGELHDCLRQDDSVVYWVRWVGAPSSSEPGA